MHRKRFFQKEINKELELACLKARNEAKLNALMKNEAHISEKVLKFNYDIYRECPELNNFSKLSSRKYRDRLVDRLSAHPQCKPGKKYSTLVKEIPSNGDAKKRCGDMRNLSIEKGEQTAQIIVVNDFYDSLETMKSYRESMDAIPKEFEDKWKELQGILEEAKGRWEEKFGRSLCERVSNLLKRKRE